MSKNRLLCILMAIIVCFSQIVEAHANLARERSQQGGFIAIWAQEKDIFVQVTRGVIMNVSGQRSGKNSCSLVGPKVEKMIFIAVGLLLGKLVFKAAGVFKRGVGAKISHAFENWRDSYYH
ncbi:hypothetical protein [Bartonella grahamii]|uniref:hypothetical protein n=1 Tax=Bartonella grahamii TaxID=33045 RepID=UPI002E7ADD1A|nr:hypothetical protein [Bartonella grahamii]